MDNGLQIDIFDKCKMIAGDRWYVKIVCVTTGSYPAEKCKELLNEEQYTAFVEKYPDCKISFQYDKERNFVDDRVKDEAVQELVDQIRDSNLDYMAKESFAENLLRNRVDEFIQEFEVRKQMGLLDNKEDVDEPDDFSACFQ